MRKHLYVVVILLVLISGNAIAAPQSGDEPQAPFIERLVKYVKRLVPRAFDGGMLTIPKP